MFGPWMGVQNPLEELFLYFLGTGWMSISSHFQRFVVIPLFLICFHATLLTHQVNAQFSGFKQLFLTDQKPVTCFFKGMNG